MQFIYLLYYFLRNIFSLQIKKHTIIESGKPGEAICHAAKEHHASMIVMGSRGQNAIRRTFVGSVSDYVLHHAHIPVTVVPVHKDRT